MPKKAVEQVQKLSNAEIKTFKLKALNLIIWSTYCYLQSLSMILSNCTNLMHKFLTTVLKDVFWNFNECLWTYVHVHVYQLLYRYLNLCTKMCGSMNFNKYSVFFFEQGNYKHSYQLTDIIINYKIIISFVLKYGINFSLLLEHNQFNFIDISLNSACKSVFLLIFPLTAWLTIV